MASVLWVLFQWMYALLLAKKPARA